MLMSSISYNSKNYVSNLKNKDDKKENGIYIDNKQIEEDDKCLIY